MRNKNVQGTGMLVLCLYGCIATSTLRQVPTNTGCNVIRDEEVQYSHGKAWMTEGGLHAAILHYHVFAPKRPGFYAVRVRVTNDQGLATISDVHTINVDGKSSEK